MPRLRRRAIGELAKPRRCAGPGRVAGMAARERPDFEAGRGEIAHRVGAPAHRAPGPGLERSERCVRRPDAEIPAPAGHRHRGDRIAQRHAEGGVGPGRIGAPEPRGGRGRRRGRESVEARVGAHRDPRVPFEPRDGRRRARLVGKRHPPLRAVSEIEHHHIRGAAPGCAAPEVGDEAPGSGEARRRFHHAVEGEPHERAAVRQRRVEIGHPVLPLAHAHHERLLADGDLVGEGGDGAGGAEGRDDAEAEGRKGGTAEWRKD